MAINFYYINCNSMTEKQETVERYSQVLDIGVSVDGYWTYIKKKMVLPLIENRTTKSVLSFEK